MENKKQGFLGAYKCLVLFAVMMVAAFVVTMFKPKAETYVAQADGFVGYVKVQVSIVNGEITAVQILESTESAGIADPALEQIPAAIVAAQSTDVDVVAGCSFASRAIMAAVDDCLVQAGLKEAPEETTAAPVVVGGAYTPGTYTASSKGFGGDVTVTITIGEDGAIAKVEMVGDGETPALGGVAMTKLPDKMIAAQSAEVDVMTGATFTSKAAIAAAADCLAQAGGSGASASYKPGTYTASSKGFGGDVTVTITIGEDGAIAKVEMVGDGETPALGGVAMTKLPDKMIAAQSAEVDVMTGATFTSKAAIAAAADCLAQAQ